MPSFIYKDIIFTPYKNISQKLTFFDIMQKVSTCFATPEGYDYNEFYRVAKENDADVDLFVTGDNVVIPALNTLFYYPLPAKERDLIRRTYEQVKYSSSSGGL